MLVMLIMLVVGVVCAKTRIVDKDANKKLTTFALYVPQVCMILASVMTTELSVTPLQILLILGVGCAMYALLVGLSFLVPKVYRCSVSDKGIYSFMTIFGNVGFMGFPVVQSIFGDAAVFYASIMNIPFNLLAYTLGISLLNSKGKETHFSWKLLLNPPLVASACSILILLLKVPVPDFVTDAVDRMGDMIVPLSMIIIGSSLGEMKLRDIFGDWRVYLFAPVRLIIAPLLVWGVLHFFVHDSLILGTMTVLAAMPVAAFATMLSIEYGGNEQVASRTVFVTTVLSVATIPFVCWLLPL